MWDLGARVAQIHRHPLAAVVVALFGLQRLGYYLLVQGLRLIAVGQMDSLDSAYKTATMALVVELVAVFRLLLVRLWVAVFLTSEVVMGLLVVEEEAPAADS